jgi:hypothetical protein
MKPTHIEESCLMNFRRPIESKGIEPSWCNLRFEATIYNYSLPNPIFNGLNLYEQIEGEVLKVLWQRKERTQGW